MRDQQEITGGKSKKVSVLFGASDGKNRHWIDDRRSTCEIRARWKIFPGSVEVQYSGWADFWPYRGGSGIS